MEVNTLIDKKKARSKMNVPTIKQLNFMLSRIDDDEQEVLKKRYELATTVYMVNFYDFNEEEKLEFDAVQRNAASQYFGGM